VLSDIFVILQQDAPISDILAALIRFACRDAKMETGCVFFKMRAGKHRLGAKTLERVNEIDAAAVAAFEGFLEDRHRAGDWRGAPPAPVAARYLVEQIGLALTQRASGEDPAKIEATMALALSAIHTP
jgi:hypothetical protein